jgi:predicted N-formylglutamate amidohydrolase
VTHTLKRHGLTREIANVMLEIRNDLISDDAGQQQWAGQNRRASSRFTGTVENRQKGQLDA